MSSFLSNGLTITMAWHWWMSFNCNFQPALTWTNYHVSVKFNWDRQNDLKFCRIFKSTPRNFVVQVTWRCRTHKNYVWQKKVIAVLRNQEKKIHPKTTNRKKRTENNNKNCKTVLWTYCVGQTEIPVNCVLFRKLEQLRQNVFL